MVSKSHSSLWESADLAYLKTYHQSDLTDPFRPIFFLREKSTKVKQEECIIQYHYTRLLSLLLSSCRNFPSGDNILPSSLNVNILDFQTSHPSIYFSLITFCKFIFFRLNYHYTLPCYYIISIDYTYFV